jgi:hypothetical protein
VLVSCDLLHNKEFRAFKNRVLMRIFGPKTEDVKEDRKLHNRERRCLYSSPDIIRLIKS